MIQKTKFRNFLHALFGKKYVFQNFQAFLVNIAPLNFEFFLAIFRKMRGRKIYKFTLLGQFLTLEKYDKKISKNLNFSSFSEISLRWDWDSIVNSSCLNSKISMIWREIWNKIRIFRR